MKKSILFIVIAILASAIISCQRTIPFNRASLKTLTDRAGELRPTDYAEAVKQVHGVLKFFDQRYSLRDIRSGSVKVMQNQDGFGEDNDLFIDFQNLDDELRLHQSQFDADTKQAYDSYLRLRERVLGY